MAEEYNQEDVVEVVIFTRGIQEFRRWCAIADRVTHCRREYALDR